VANKAYLLSHLRKECYTEEYFKWFPLIFITFLLSAFVYPITIFIILLRNKSKLNNPYMYRIERRYGFLYAEYKPSCWWWEVMKILLRQIIIIVTKVPAFELLEKALIIVLLLQCYLLFAFQKKPYKNNKLNQVDL